MGHVSQGLRNTRELLAKRQTECTRLYAQVAELESELEKRNSAKESLRINNKHLAKIAELEGIMFNLLSLNSFVWSYPVEAKKLKALQVGES
jgi:hypothetical protein